MAVKKVIQPGIGTREPINKQSGVGTQEPMKQEHSQQQARVHEATQCDKAAETKQREEWVYMFQKMFYRVRMWMRSESPRRRRMHARSNPKVPAEKQWDTEAHGPEHHGAYLEQATCLR